MTIGSLFSGIGGLELGLEESGHGPVLYQVENNEFCNTVLAKHWPNVLRFQDVRTVDPKLLPPVDLICGGFPCQDVSSAGKSAGLAGARSGLWYEFRRIVDGARPAKVVVENVTSGAKRWLPHVRRDLHVLGYRTRAFSLSAADVGGPHLRRRIFVVAADPHRVELRDEPGWRGGANREDSALAEFNGGAGYVADTRSEGLEERSEQQARGQQPAPERGRLPDDAWSSEPEVGRVAHGVPRRVDRLRGLGNAVVPQCAATIGRVMKELCT